jgi:hypothetical protein
MVDLSAVAVLISVCASAAVSVIHSIQDSRCTSIRACGGCIDCVRAPREERTPEVETGA